MNVLSIILYVVTCMYIIVNPLISNEIKFKHVSFGDYILFLIFVIYFLNVILNKDSRNRFINGIRDFFTDYLTLSISGLFLIMLISVTYAAEKGMALQETFRFFTYAALFFIIKYEFAETKLIKGFLGSYIVCTIIMSVFGIVQYFTKFELNKNFVKTDGFLGRPKVTVSLDNANNFGAFLVLAIFPIIMLMIYVKGIKKKAFYLLLSLALAMNIVFCYSRNAMLGFVIGLVVLAIIYSLKLIVPIGGLGILMFLIPQIGSRIMDIGNSSENFTRLKLWKTAWYMIKDHPIRGVGNGNFVSLYDSYVAKYHELYIYYDYKRFPCHNSYLKIQSELGIFGTIFFISILINALIRIKKLTDSLEDKFLKYFYTGFFASVIAFLVMNLSDNLFFVPKTTSFFWMLLAMGEALRRCQKSEFYR
ncbi:O-antigen ligase family protein [Clostridium fermenticellae]|uniref:O-antigen ligase family protein n=1 Tax=Clostridium fermenticellae TaxID=2068654 RepID=A0A386H2C3_9CLOT|nr:O-antigen ligase [Clostridium fermenticellae]AYD39804.1 O-antigen ligase family protein [Clostridium fermenticellae]